MTKGMVITAHTSAGTIQVVAGAGFTRTYSWHGCERSVTLWPRTERWYGSRGIYYPGPGITWWWGCDGINRAVVEEGQQHFATMPEALAWLQKPHGLTFVYRKDGLAVGWDLVPSRGQLDVDVWQVYVAGKKPVALDGGDDAAISVAQTTQQPATPAGGRRVRGLSHESVRPSQVSGSVTWTLPG